MASKDALRAVCESIKTLLQSRLGEWTEKIEVGVTSTLAKPFKPADKTITILPFRLFPNGDFRNPLPPPGPDGVRRRPSMPLDLHLLLTAWAEDPNMQTAMAGWMMRVLHDHPTFSAVDLNAAVPNSFEAEETVDVLLTDLSTENLLRVWELLPYDHYVLSVPYVARVIRIRSEVEVPTQPATERVFDVRVAGDA